MYVRCPNCGQAILFKGADTYCSDCGLKVERKKKPMLKVKLDDGAFMPERAHSADAGLDLRVPSNSKPIVFLGIWGESAVIDTGVHIEIPEGWVGLVKSRSGNNIKRGLQCEGVIDSGYTGSIAVKLYHHSRTPEKINPGDKIAQLVIVPCNLDGVELVEELEETERGANGFGSTGR